MSFLLNEVVAGTTLTPDAKCRAASAASEKTRRLGVAQRQTSNIGYRSDASLDLRLRSSARTARSSS